MAPPKRSPTDSATTAATANNFFTRGKKPTTTNRIVTAKKAAVAAAPTKKVHHHQRDENDFEEEDEVSDEIEHADTDEDEDVQIRTPPPPQQHIDEDEDDLVEDEYDSLNEEIEQSGEEDSDTVMATTVTTGRTMRSAGNTGKAAAAPKAKLEPITRPAAAKITKSSLPTRSSAAKGVTKDNKYNKAAPYVAPDIGDIHRGFHQADLSDSEKMLRQFDLASKYGPCTDLTRLERWERAFTLGLHPPQHVKDTLIQHSSLNTPLFEGRV